jgi:sugar fermentation stimulation protein A
MQLPELHRGTIIKRYKRFLADVELEDGTLVTAHCPNTGSMTSCWRAGAPVELSHSDNPKRKLAWTLERVDMGGGWIGVHTGRPNHVIAEGIQLGRIPSLTGYASLRQEVPYTPEGHAKSRIDILLSDGPRPDALVEVKNTTLLVDGVVRFPDAVSERGRKHLEALLTAVKSGMRGVILFAVNRPEGTHFAPAGDIDPRYAYTLREVVAQGVEAVAARIRHSGNRMEVTGTLEVVLDD